MDQNNSNSNPGSNSNATPADNQDNKSNSPMLSTPDTSKPAENAPDADSRPWDELKKNEEAKPLDETPKEGGPLVDKKEEAKLDAQITADTGSSDPQKPKKRGIPLPIIIVFLIVSFLCGLLIAGWYFQDQLQANKVAKETAAPVKQTIIIGTDATAPPMESVNKQGGLIGYDIDLGYRLANDIGAKAQFKDIPWDPLFKALEEKKIDMIIASVTITDERKQKYNFSDPYINAGQVIVSRKDHMITSVADLKGKKISVQTGTTNEQEAFKYTDKSLVLSYASYADAAKAVSVGTSEAFLSDLTLAKGFISQFENIKITSDPFTNEYYGIVFRKDEPDLQKKVNDALSVLRVNGILTDLKQKWLE